MAYVPVTVPKIFRWVFPKVTWDIPSKEKVLYLTFDDGPTPEITNWVLDQLDTYNAKSTFFCIGKNIEEYPEIFKNIVNQGHTIGNHTYNHLKGWKTNTETYLDDIRKAQEVISHQSTSHNHQLLFRPPYGQITPNQIKRLKGQDYKIIMWSIVSIDWDASISKEKCLKNVINNAKSGSVIVFHDSVKASKNMQYALPKVLEYFSKKGYVFKRIPE